MQVLKTKTLSRICLITIIIMALLTGCGSSGNRITPLSDYNAFHTDFDFMDSSTKQVISDLIKSSVDWYNEVEIPKDYSPVDVDVFTSAPFTKFGEQLSQINEEHDYRSGSDEGMKYLKGTMPALDIAGSIWGITTNNDLEVTVGSDTSASKIQVSEDDWNNIKNKITTAIDFYYGDGDRSEMNAYTLESATKDAPVEETPSKNDTEPVSNVPADKAVIEGDHFSCSAEDFAALAQKKYNAKISKTDFGQGNTEIYDFYSNDDLKTNYAVVENEDGKACYFAVLSDDDVNSVVICVAMCGVVDSYFDSLSDNELIEILGNHYFAHDDLVIFGIPNDDGKYYYSFCPREYYEKNYKELNKENAGDSNQHEGNSSQNNDTSQETHFCEECGRVASHSMTGVASGKLEWYCDEHWNEIQGIIGNMEKDVGEGSASKHQCQASGCSKEGTHQIVGISGEYEYYCTEHYQAIVDMYNKMKSQ